MTKDVLTTILVNAAVFSVLFIIMLILRRLLGKRLSPALMLALWVLVVIKLLIPYGFESDFGLFTAPQTVADAPANAGTQIPIPSAQAQISSDAPQTDTITNHNSAIPLRSAQDPIYKAVTPSPAVTVDWAMLVFGVWAAGFMAILAVLLISTMNIKRRIRHARLQTPENLREVFEECKALLGVKRRVGLCVQSAFGMPMMMGTIRPCLVVPENVLTLDNKTLRHIMLHELSHLKRGDLLLIYGLNLLSAIYWFNPLTWLCFKLIRDDIETACDHSVFAAVGAGNRLDYIETIMYFAGSANERRLAAAMALSHRRSAMEKRITGMFKTAKTHILGRCAAVCMALLMLSVSVLTACQPTPEEPVIVNKNDGKLEEKMQETPAPPQPYEAPAHWSETAEGEKLNIVIDTDVALPDVSAYPVIKLEQRALTQEQVNNMVHYFAGDAKLYLPHVLTKADYDEQIVQAKRGTEVDGEFVVTEDSKAWVKELERMRDEAPDESPIIYTDATLTYMKDEFGKDDVAKGKNYLSVCFENEDGGEGYLAAINDTTGNSRQCGFGYGRSQDLFYITESMYQENVGDDFSEEDSGWVGAGALFDKVKIAKEDAQTMAQKVIDDLDISDLALISAEKAVSIEEPEKCGYRFTYARQGGGIAVYKFEGGGYHKDEQPPAYSPPFLEETVQIDVSPDGIEYFSWNGISKVVETVSDNVQLLPFENIQQALKDQIFYKKSFNNINEMPGLSNYEIDVISAQLRMGYIGVKDNDAQALFVPVWVFKTISGNDNAVLNKHQSHPDDTYVLNAIDGGVIEPKRIDFKDIPKG